MILISLRLPHRPLRLKLLMLVGLVCACLAGCVSSPIPETVLHDSQRGWIHLSKMPGSSFHASHPLSLDEPLIARVLQGIRVQARQGAPTTLIFGSATQVQLFSEQDVEFLAPLVAKALTEAKADQAVSFGVMHASPLDTVSTGGILFASGQALSITLTHYRSPFDPSTGHEMVDYTKLYRLEIEFVPKEALQLENPSRMRPKGLGYLSTLVISYDRLAALPIPPMPSPHPGQEKADFQAKDSRNAELDRLREENRSLKRKLRELEADLHRLK